MKRLRLAAVCVLLLALVCFLSIPVVAELPWDSDNDGGGSGGGGNDGDGTNIDTTVYDGVDNPLTTSGGEDFPSWLVNLMSRYTYPLVFYQLLGPGTSTDNMSAGTGTVGSSTKIGLTESTLR